MDILTKEQIEKFMQKLNKYKTELQDMSKVTAVRGKLLTVISTIYGDKSSEYKRCCDIGFSSWTNGGYSAENRDSFVQLIDGIIDSLEIVGDNFSGQLSEVQTVRLISKLNVYKNELENISNISAVREKLLTVISTIYGDKSSEYKRCRDIGFSSWTTGRYSKNDRDSFVQLIDGILGSLEITG